MKEVPMDGATPDPVGVDGVMNRHEGRFRKRRFSRFALAVAAGATAVGCLRTSVLVEKFNDGVIETGSGDPAHPPADLRLETARRRIDQELIDGYFGQSRADSRVVAWLARDAGTADPSAPNHRWFSESVRQWLCSRGKTAKVPCPPLDGAAAAATDGGKAVAPQTAQMELTEKVAGIAKVLPDQEPVCPDGKRRDGAVEALSDTVRYRLALRRAVEAGGNLVDEGQIPLAELDRAAAGSFQHASAYLANRKWQRRLSQPTVGLVVKGGASTGIFSAGAVWVALNIDRECSRDDQCKQLVAKPRFDLMSGTSTGALIAAAVDIYNVAECDAQRVERLKLFQEWFVCSPANELYCTVDGTILDLLTKDQLSLLEFDGLRRLLTGGVQQATLANRSELLLNVVDFRTGRLDTFSDQDPTQLVLPEHVGNAAIASAALPVIVQPEPHLPSEPSIKGKFAYLDGGIRSELPLSAAIRRGAERLMVVSSSPSVMGESKELQNGFNVLVRYIDVSTGGVLESEIDWAPRLVESRRLAEYTECTVELQNQPALCPGGSCNPVALCSGDWPKVCQPPEKPPNMPPNMPDTIAAARTAEDLVSPIWRTTAIYRDERRVPGLPGYVFRRADQRKLFLAGAEEARQRCFEIASLLGLPTATADTSFRQKLLQWCSPTPEPEKTLCAALPADESMRSCSDHLPPPTSPRETCPASR